MFPYIKLTLDEDSVMWIRHDTIAQVYLDNDDTTTISTTTEEHDFSVQETVDEVIEMLRVFYHPIPVSETFAPNPFENGGW